MPPSWSIGLLVIADVLLFLIFLIGVGVIR